MLPGPLMPYGLCAAYPVSHRITQVTPKGGRPLTLKLLVGQTMPIIRYRGSMVFW